MTEIKANWPPPDLANGFFRQSREKAARELRSKLEEYLKHKADNPDLQKEVDGILGDLLSGENVLWKLEPDRKSGHPSDGLDRVFAILDEMYRLHKFGLSKRDAKALLIAAMKASGERGDFSKQIDRASAWQPYMPLED